MVASVLLARGVAALAQLEAGLGEALAAAGFESVEAARGLLALREGAPATTERTAYLRAFVDAAARA